MVPLAMSMLLGSGGGARSMSPVAGIMLFLGPALGPSLGGVLIGVWGWRAIFLVNLPIGVAAAISARRIPRMLAAGRQPAARFDVVGWILLAAGLALLLFGAGNSETGGWADTRDLDPAHRRACPPRQAMRRGGGGRRIRSSI